MEIAIILPESFQPQTVRDLLETEWLIPRKVRHFLRTRKNVAVNGEPALFHYPVQAGDLVTLTFEASDYLEPQVLLTPNPNLEVLFEDEHLIVLNKPAGIKTHPNQPNECDTLQNQVAAYLAPKQQFPYVVHRLDKETSGAILFAKNPVVLPLLGRLLEQKKIDRQYQALATGLVQPAQQTIRAKIGRDRHDRRKRVVDPRKGAHAVTHIDVVNYDCQHNQSALVCTLETGRTHQIRVHLASIGHPLIGDPLYHPKPKGRLRLHAYRLRLLHPFTHERIEVTTPNQLWSD